MALTVKRHTKDTRMVENAYNTIVCANYYVLRLAIIST